MRVKMLEVVVSEHDEGGYFVDHPFGEAFVSKEKFEAYFEPYSLLEPTQFKYKDHPIYVVERDKNKYAISLDSPNSGAILDKNLNEVWEPSPSNRTEEFKNNTRFTLKEAEDPIISYINKFCT